MADGRRLAPAGCRPRPQPSFCDHEPAAGQAPDLLSNFCMSTDEPTPVHRKDQLRIEDGVIHPADELDRVNDHAPTEGAGPERHDRDEPLPRRPTDGPM